MPSQKMIQFGACVVFRKIFDNKLELGEIWFENEGFLSIHKRPVLNHHNNKGKEACPMVSIVKRDEEMTSRPEV